jgi:RNA polymerase-binding transcription factor DksA
VDVQEVRLKLKAELDTLEARSGRLTRHLRREDEALPDDWEERGTSLSNDEVVEALDLKTRARIDAIRAAIGRIDDGSWGECLECGRDIAPARILAVPTTRMCIKCASKANHA